MVGGPLIASFKAAKVRTEVETLSTGSPDELANAVRLSQQGAQPVTRVNVVTPTTQRGHRQVARLGSQLAGSDVVRLVKRLTVQADADLRSIRNVVRTVRATNTGPLRPEIVVNVDRNLSDVEVWRIVQHLTASGNTRQANITIRRIPGPKQSRPKVDARTATPSRVTGPTIARDPTKQAAGQLRLGLKLNGVKTKTEVVRTVPLGDDQVRAVKRIAELDRTTRATWERPSAHG